MTAALVSFLWRDSPFGGLATLRVLFKLDKDAEENYACPTLPSAFIRFKIQIWIRFCLICKSLIRIR